jgi:hypothetical protein
MQRNEAGLGTEADQREQERYAGPCGRQRRRAHRVKRELPGATLHHAEREQDRNRAEMRDQEVEESCAADVGDAVLRRDQEIRGECHRLPGHHVCVGVVGDDHERHAGEKGVVLQAKQSRRRALARAEVSGTKG